MNLSIGIAEWHDGDTLDEMLDGADRQHGANVRGETKLRLSGKVTNSAPGFGIGVSFVNASPQARAILERQVAALLTQG